MEKREYIWSVTGYTTFGWGKSKYIVPYCSDQLCWEHLYNTTRIATPAVIVYRKALEENRFAMDMKNGQDTYLWYRLANRYKLGVINESLVKVRKRRNSTYRNTFIWKNWLGRKYKTASFSALVSFGSRGFFCKNLFP